MAKNRKQKKAEARQQRQQQQKGNKQPASNNGKAAKAVAGAATVVKDALEKAKAKKQASQKVVIGFGPRSEKSNIVHAITNVDNSVLCDSRVKNIQPIDWMTINSLTCKKCHQYTIVKQLLTTAKEDKPKPDDKKSAEVKKQAKPAEAKPEEKTEEPDDMEQILESLKNVFSVRFRRMEKRLEKKLQNFCEVLLEKRPEFFIVRAAKDRFDIIHDPSRLVLVKSVNEATAENLLLDLLAMPLKWDGINKLPKVWVTEVRKVTEKHLSKKQEPQQTTLLKKRRKRVKKEKPVLKLRRRRNR